MAVDTVAKRYSLIGFGSPTPRLLPIPDGTIAAADRAMLLYLYHGIALSAAVVEAPSIAAAVFGPNNIAIAYGPNPNAPLEADR